MCRSAISVGHVDMLCDCDFNQMLKFPLAGRHVRDTRSQTDTVKCSTFSVISGGTMATVKTATLTFRIDPGLKEALRIAADQEHRSIANMVEVLIRSYCERHDIVIPHSGETKNTSGARS
ncbi:MAG: DUF3641 domain-containing protein [Rhodanobacteraceae bacterium]|nr:DUF3641 domain-containing protein [Rhodanobacteraceae bacterium]